MALKVWLPLNGNLENIGTDSVEVTNNGATVDNSGKIGKCYSFNGSNNYLKSTYNFYNNKFSVSAWVYSTKNNVTQTIVCDRTATGSGFSIFLISGKLRIDPGGNGLQWTTSYTYPVNTWFHLTVTHDGTNVSYYINGEFKETKAQALNSSYWGNTTSIGASQANNSGYGNYLNGKLNDIRIYDHCLSKLEVKEIAQGLVLHYKLDGFNGGTGENLVWNSDWRKGSFSSPDNWRAWGSPTTREIVTINNKKWLHLVSTTTTFQGWQQNWTNRDGFGDILPNTQYTVTFTAFIKTAASFAPIGIHWNNSSGTILTQSWPNVNLTTVPTRYNYTATTPANCSSFNIMVGDNSNVAHEIWITDIKLEKGSTATPWCPAPSELGKDSTKIIDSSGYNNDGIAVNNPVIIDNLNGRHNICTSFNGSNTYINAGTGAKVKDAVTVAWWGYMDSWANYTTRGISCTDGGGWTFEKSGNYIRFAFGTGASSNTYKYATGTTTVANMGSGWHHFVGTFDGLNSAFYFDGVQQYSQATFTTKTPLYYNASNSIIVGAEASGGAVPAGYYFNGKISDVRIYATALDADDVLALYKTSAQIDKSKGFHTFAISEGNDKAVRKNGVTEIQNISEFDALAYLKYDPNLHIEPDGSAWVHIYHHNHPDLGSFASTDTFAASVKKDENRWFNGTQVCNQLNKWEFLIKYAFTEGGTEYKERWIQTKNPESAVFGDVDAADITRITGDGYKTGTWGGLYKKNANAYWVMNNGNSGNWFGATGSFSIYQGGIPGYGGGTITTTGYNDLYVRIDNVLSTVSTNSRLTKSGILIGSNFIEK